MALRMGELVRSTLTELRIEPTPRRVRVLVGDTTIADTTRAMVVWEPRRGVPVYAVPEADLTAELVPFSPPPPPADLPPFLGPENFAMHTTPGEALSVRVDGQELPGAAFRPEDPDLAGYIVLDFGAFSWIEEDEPVIGHPHDPFKRIDVLRSDRHVVVSLEGVVLADSKAPMALLETHLPVRWYLPRDDVRMDLFTPSDTRTVCAYKGEASYLSVTDGGANGRDLAWSYPQPLNDAAQVRDMVAFFLERCDISVDGTPMGRPVTPWSSQEEQRRGLDFA
jgi:uncharacterized protein (DUF427 family)